MDRYKFSILIGTVAMGIGSFMGCLVENPLFISLGNGFLIVSIFAMVYRYFKWQP